MFVFGSINLQGGVDGDFLENLIRILVIAAFFLGPFIKSIIERNKAKGGAPRPPARRPQATRPPTRGGGGPSPVPSADPWERLLRGEDPRDVATAEYEPEVEEAPEPVPSRMPNAMPEPDASFEQLAPAAMGDLERKLAETRAIAKRAEAELEAEFSAMGSGISIDMPGDDFGASTMALPSSDTIPGLGSYEQKAEVSRETIWPELADPAAARRAFVLLEILGPPIAMRSEGKGPGVAPGLG